MQKSFKINFVATCITAIAISFYLFALIPSAQKLGEINTDILQSAEAAPLRRGINMILTFVQFLSFGISLIVLGLIGFKYMTAGTNIRKKEEALSWLGSWGVGLGIVLGIGIISSLMKFIFVSLDSNVGSLFEAS